MLYLTGVYSIILYAENFGKWIVSAFEGFFYTGIYNYFIITIIIFIHCMGFRQLQASVGYHLFMRKSSFL